MLKMTFKQSNKRNFFQNRLIPCWNLRIKINQRTSKSSDNNLNPKFPIKISIEISSIYSCLNSKLMILKLKDNKVRQVYNFLQKWHLSTKLIKDMIHENCRLFYHKKGLIELTSTDHSNSNLSQTWTTKWPSKTKKYFIQTDKVHQNMKFQK